MALKDLTDAQLAAQAAELKAEQQRREEEREKARVERHAAHVTKLKDILTEEMVNVLRRHHDRTSCSDTKLANGWGSVWTEQGRELPRCVRCALLEIARGNDVPDDHAYVTLTVTLEEL